MASSSEFSPMFPRDTLSLQSSKRLSKKSNQSLASNKENTPVLLPIMDPEDISVFNKSHTVLHSPIKLSSNKKRGSNEVSVLSRQLKRLNISTEQKSEDLPMEDGFNQLEHTLVTGLRLRDLKVSLFNQAKIVEPLTCF